MDDRDLDTILRHIASERIAPPEGLVRRTKARLRGRRLLQATIVLSIAMQLAALGGAAHILFSPQVPAAAKAFGAASLVAWAGAAAIAVVAGRGYVAWFFRRVERVMG